MKKALVLGVLAIFAIGIANVNAQDRTNVQQKPKKTYAKESTAKDGKAINQKISDPTSKNVSAPAAPAATSKKTLPKNSMKGSENKAINDNAPVDDKTMTTNKLNELAKEEKKAAEAENAKDNKSVNINSSKKPAGVNNSVPPTPKKASAKSQKGKTAQTK